MISVKSISASIASLISSILVFCLLIPSGLFAQAMVTIRCAFGEPVADTVFLIPEQYLLEEYEKTYAAIPVQQSCSFQVPAEKPLLMQLSFRGKSLVLFTEPGNQLQIRAAGDSLHADPVFSGSGAEQNQWLRTFYKLFANDFDPKKIKSGILSMDADAYEMQLFEQRKKQLANYHAAAATIKFTDDFKLFVEHAIKYNYYARLLSYPIIQANESAQSSAVKPYPAVMLEGIDSTLLNDQALNTEPYRDFLYYYTVYFASEANDFKKFRDLNLSLEKKVQTAMLKLNGQSLTWCLAYLLNSEVNRVSQYTARHIYNILSRQDKEGTYTTLLKKKVDARLSAKDAVVTNEGDGSDKGNTSEAGINYPKLKDINGNYFTLNDLKGKVVYIDFWASWCGPCRQQMPYSKQLHSMFDEKQQKQIVFLYISIDATEEAWKAGIQQLGLEGMHGISPGNWQSPIAKYFGISGIPRYMLMNKKGEIVELNARRPSLLPDIYNDILKLLD